MTTMKEANDKDIKIYRMAEEVGLQALRHDQILERQRNTLSTFKTKLREEKQKTKTLEEELQFTRKRLLTHMSRSVPRRCKRVRRRITEEDNYESTVTADSDTDVEDEQTTNNMLIAAMDTSCDA